MTTGDKETGWFPHREARAFDAVYAEHGARIYRFCHRLCGNPADAEDLAQEVFLAAYQGLTRFQGRSSLSTWLYRIAIYRWHVRRSRREPETVPLDEESSEQRVATDSAQAQLDRMSLDDAIAALPEDWRRAFLLVKAEGLTCREAAEALEIPEGTLKFRVQRAVRRLQVLLRLGEEDPASVSGGCRPLAHQKTGVRNEM